MASKVRFGLSDVKYALRTVDANGNISYASPVSLPGAVNLDLEQQGANEPFYADNIVYYQAIGNMGYQGDLEVAMIPDEFRQNILGQTLDSTSKIITEKNTDEVKTFALIFKTLTDAGERDIVLYNCTVTRPNIGGATLEDTKTPATQTLSITATPNADGKVCAYTTEATASATLTSFFTAVYGYGA